MEINDEIKKTLKKICFNSLLISLSIVTFFIFGFIFTGDLGINENSSNLFIAKQYFLYVFIRVGAIYALPLYFGNFVLFIKTLLDLKQKKLQIFNALIANYDDHKFVLGKKKYIELSTKRRKHINWFTHFIDTLNSSRFFIYKQKAYKLESLLQASKAKNKKHEIVATKFAHIVISRGSVLSTGR